MNYKVYTFWLAIFGAICWGIAPLFGKSGLKELTPLDGLAARTLITVILVGSGFLFNGGISGVLKLKDISIHGWLFLALEAFLATFAGDLAYYSAIKYGDIGKTALILASSPLITLWFGWYFLNEGLSLVKLLGAILIVGGIVLVGIE